MADKSFVSEVLKLPFFQEPDEILLTPEEEKQLELQADQEALNCLRERGLDALFLHQNEPGMEERVE